MQQSSNAQDCKLGDWYSYIEKGNVKLPRFQRYEAWDKNRIASFLNTIINNLPVGVALVLEVDGTKNEPFISRYISTAEPQYHGAVNQHLLDGQQRLTSFWRSINDNYEWESYFVFIKRFAEYLSDDSDEPDYACRVNSRWYKNDKRYPLWADIPSDCLSRGLIPISLLKPTPLDNEINYWIQNAIGHKKPDVTEFLGGKESSELAEALEKYKLKENEYHELENSLRKEITKLRERVQHFNLPFLRLPSSTPKDVALQVFINMNTNSKPLSLYDVVVAEIESVSGKSLHEYQNEMLQDHPEIARYGNVGDLILSTAALLQTKVPNQRGMLEMCKAEVVNDWEKIVKGLAGMSKFLFKQGVYDSQRLPTNAVLAVISACLAQAPEAGDKLGQIENFLTRYLWRGFFTERYENSTASRAFADYKEFSQAMNGEKISDQLIEQAPIFTDDYQIADVQQLIGAGWPKKTGTLARAILAVSTHLGALDFADQQAATYESIQTRHYHHIYPDALLTEAGLDDQSYKALNCALVSGKTNLSMGRKDPLQYLTERVDSIDSEVVEYRLKTHLINFHTLQKATYDGLSGDELKSKVRSDYDFFLHERAELIFKAVTQLTAGKAISVESLFGAKS